LHWPQADGQRQTAGRVRPAPVLIDSLVATMSPVDHDKRKGQMVPVACYYFYLFSYRDGLRSTSLLILTHICICSFTVLCIFFFQNEYICILVYWHTPIKHMNILGWFNHCPAVSLIPSYWSADLLWGKNIMCWFIWLICSGEKYCTSRRKRSWIEISNPPVAFPIPSHRLTSFSFLFLPFSQKKFTNTPLMRRIKK
jgi:hypothetical protein